LNFKRIKSDIVSDLIEPPKELPLHVALSVLELGASLPHSPRYPTLFRPVRYREWGRTPLLTRTGLGVAVRWVRGGREVGSRRRRCLPADC
jgi:hypothetical protein